MKKLTYLVIATAALGMAACTGNKPGYVVTGTVEGASDGDTVYLQEANGRNLIKLDTAVITKGSFTFKGAQDSTVNRYITCEVDGEPLMIDFFLENGKINIALTKGNDSATGTANNDAYQEIRTQINDISQKMNAIYEAMGDSSLSDEQKEAKQKEGAQLEEQYDKVIKEGVQKNITNPVGVFLFKQTFYNNSTAENEALLQQVPANFQNDETIVRIKELTEKQKKTAVGTKFVDFEMQNPEGKTVKLSDYAGKGKVVLVDFWASWCGPCRREMPNLVEAYAKYKGDKFEIVGVSLDQDGAAWKEAIKKLNMTWPQMSDLKFWQSEGAQLYAVNSIPHTVLIDGEGTIIARGLHGEELQTQIAEAIK
ncbi:TlpA disulfide reductase family protein [uncultured Bacteroides sp.]|uniref:TlpA disulfide reductase family protein n=1 Tax=uncultured Bacteroides sp. TaxID=162156 RepID=UPI0026758F33|nr:TlpA disulfide reductase family protein [uncultured Bacteroides sp.]